MSAKVSRVGGESVKAIEMKDQVGTTMPAFLVKLLTVQKANFSISNATATVGQQPRQENSPQPII